MQTSTIILMLVGIVAVLTALVVVLLWLMHRKDEDLRQKNDVIIYEVRRNQSLIDKAVAQGINRAALF
jgi:flagellar basal body-associated protein FliL